MVDKRIILTQNQPPKFEGTWTIGEVRQMVQGLLIWLDGIPLTEPASEPEKEGEHG